eukprot:3757675-Lingulodinium_polyedra.AAC.1
MGRGEQAVTASAFRGSDGAQSSASRVQRGGAGSHQEVESSSRLRPALGAAAAGTPARPSCPQ